MDGRWAVKLCFSAAEVQKPEELLQRVDPRTHLSGLFSGNGPSGICLSYLLSGYTPYLSPGAWHPNPLLHSKLSEQPHLSLLEQVSAHAVQTPNWF